MSNAATGWAFLGLIGLSGALACQISAPEMNMFKILDQGCSTKDVTKDVGVWKRGIIL